ncbi:four helix bundle protein [Opitutus sp. ER46]|uniref:four helix bundle protein n=1 Tax=Opitutus sp. ER46 TaxID=2161864 RepID=UPI000D322488|nr:four helix bundle protein [Opitutus sp. ER46]PTX98598.1 four helix bundle protein [Opitutus sp. ER46]
MPAIFDHERLVAYQRALKFIAWVAPLLDELPAKISVRDQLDRASTSIPLNLAEGNGKRSFVDRSRYLDSARGSGLECAACLDVLVTRRLLTAERADEGKSILLEVVSTTAGLIAHFAKQVREEQAEYGAAGRTEEKEEEEEEEEEKE